MLKLDFKQEPYWIDLLSGVRVQVKPIASDLVMMARVEAMRELGEEEQENGAAFLLRFLRHLARGAILAWEGVGDRNGNELELSPKGVDALMSNVQAFDAFDRLYLRQADLLEQEKNG